MMNKLTFLHSRKFGYMAFTLAVLGLEIFFAWRVSIVYGELMAGQASATEIKVLKIMVFAAVAVFGFVLATHRHYGVATIRERIKKGANWSAFGVFMAVVVMIAHDWGAAIYSALNGRTLSFGLLAITIGMCGLALVPYLVGQMARVMGESLSAEERERYEREEQKAEHEQRMAALQQGVGKSRSFRPSAHTHKAASNGRVTSR